MYLMLSCSTLIIATALDAWVCCAFDNVSATQVASGQVDPEVEMDKVQQHAYRWDSQLFYEDATNHRSFWSSAARLALLIFRTGFKSEGQRLAALTPRSFLP